MTHEAARRPRMAAPGSRAGPSAGPANAKPRPIGSGHWRVASPALLALGQAAARHGGDRRADHRHGPDLFVLPAI